MPPTVEQLFQNYPVTAIVPEVALTIFALAVLLAGAFLGDAQRRIGPILALLGVAVTGLTLVPLWNGEGAETFGAANSAIFLSDNFSLFFKWIFLLGLGVSVLLSGRFLGARGGDRHTVIGEYLGLMMLSTVGMMIVASAADLLTIFLGVETLSIALYILAGFARTRLMSNEAALKYFLLGAFATGFLLYGIALTYFAVGSTHLATIAATIADNSGTGGVRSMPILLIGVAFLLIGLGFKAALVPFHQWTPDVYEGSPTPVTAFMAVGAKAAAFAALLRVFPEAFGGLSSQWHGLVLVIAVLTMSIGNIVALSQDSLKRMLAYSSIAHAGYIMVGVLAAGAANHAGDRNGAADAVASVLFYSLVYALMNLGAFAVLVHIENAHVEQRGMGADENANIGSREISGLGTRNPAAAFAFAVFLLSLAGIPPTAGFFGKFFVFREAVAQGLIGLVIVGVLNSVISIYYYLRPVVTMYNADKPVAAGVGADGTIAAQPIVARPMAISVGIAIGLCVVLVLGMIVLQGIAMPLAQNAARSLLGAR